MDQYVGGPNLDLKNFPAKGSGPVGDNAARELALELLAACPTSARAAAVAIHERVCERGNDAHAALWGAVLEELAAASLIGQWADAALLPPAESFSPSISSRMVRVAVSLPKALPIGSLRSAARFRGIPPIGERVIRRIIGACESGLGDRDVEHPCGLRVRALSMVRPGRRRAGLRRGHGPDSSKLAVRIRIAGAITHQSAGFDEFAVTGIR